MKTEEKKPLFKRKPVRTPLVLRIIRAVGTIVVRILGR